MALENENVVNEEALNNASQPNQGAPSEMLKPWLKTAGKKFYQNEVLAKYDSLQDALDGLMANQNTKEVPATYGYGDADELFKKASLSKAEADEINGYYADRIIGQNTMEEIFGDNVKEGQANFEKAMSYLGAEKADGIRKSKLDKNKAFVEAMAHFGKEIGPMVFNPSARDGRPTRVNYFEEIIKNGNNRGN